MSDPADKGHEAGSPAEGDLAGLSRAELIRACVRLREQLDAEVRDREAAERLLRDAKETAEAATRAKSLFLANMSHEIRTPMNGIVGMVTLLLDSKVSSEQRDNLKTVARSADALVAIIDQLLDFSKAEAGHLALDEVDFDIRPLVEDVLDLLALQAHKKGVELNGLVSSRVPARLRGDPGRLRQVLVNLVGNAVKFTDHGSVCVRVKLREQDGSGIRLRITVQDTGIGLDEGGRKRIFESFAQAEPATARRFGGTGLGLAVSKALVELMGGQIGVRSAAGAGSTFWFTVRLGAGAPGTGEVVAVAYEGLRVLLAANHAETREVLMHLLEQTAVDCEPVAPGEEMMDRLRDEAAAGRPFDVVVLDSDGAGKQHATRLGEDSRLGATALLLLVPHGGQPGSRQAALTAAATLVKPIRRNMLFDCIRATAEGVAVGASTTGLSAEWAWSADGELAAARAKILLVDDSDVNLLVGRKLLARLGCDVETAKDGFEALRAVARSRYDLVFMDWQMPGMDGLKATETIRERHAWMPIVAMTANAMGGDRERCLAAGMDDYIAKPITAASLGAVLARWIDPNRAQ